MDSELVDTLMWNHDEIIGAEKGTPDWGFRPGKSTRKWVHSRLMTRRVRQGGTVNGLATYEWIVSWLTLLCGTMMR